MKTCTLFLTILYLFPISLFIATPTQAAIYTGGITEIKAGEVIEDDVIITGQKVVLDGTIKGDAYIAAESVVIKGKIEGDLLVAGAQVTISGASIRDDVRAAGSSITLDNTQIGDNLTLLSGSTIATKTKVGGSLLTGTGMLQFEGEVGRNLYGGAGAINLSGNVGKEVKVYTDSLTLGADTVIKGPLTYYSSQDAVVAESARIEGGVKREVAPENQSQNRPFSSSSTRFYFFFAMLLIGLLLVHFLPRPLGIIEDQMRAHPVASGVWGMIIFLLTFPLVVLLAVTGVGLPLAVILMMLFVIEILIAPIIVGLALSRFILTNLSQNSSSLMLHLIVGLAAYYLLTTIPMLNGLVWLLARFMTLGAIFLYTKQVLSVRPVPENVTSRI